MALKKFFEENISSLERETISLKREINRLQRELETKNAVLKGLRELLPLSWEEEIVPPLCFTRREEVRRMRERGTLPPLKEEDYKL